MRRPKIMLTIIAVIVGIWIASAIAWKAKQAESRYQMNEFLSEFGFGSYREKMHSGCLMIALKIIAGIIGSIVVLTLCT